MKCMCHQGVTTKQRALCAVLTRATCARRGCSCHSHWWCTWCHCCCPHRSCSCCCCIRTVFVAIFRSGRCTLYSSSTELDTGTGEMSLLVASSRSRTWISPTVGEEGEDEEDEEECLLFHRCPWSWCRSRRRAWQAWDLDGNEVLCVADNPNSVFNEMWFLTIDPFVGIHVFIAELSERQLLLACCRGLSLSRMFPILWHTQLPLLAFALHRWRLWLS